ncbi:hypothetical protein [Photobacterium indicum]|uniref:hypothetical protein n=1 Tax=Photobacterium indicum TaxID=81447 RepID=UPI003D14DDED
MNTLQLTASISMFVFGLTACGGGGGEGESVNNTTVETPSKETVATIPITPAPVVAEKTMQDIVVDKNYDFSTSYTLPTNIDISQHTDKRTYIGFYTDWSTNAAGDNMPNPASQLVLQTTDNGIFNNDLQIGKHQTQLLLVVLFTESQLSTITKLYDITPEQTLNYP